MREGGTQRARERKREMGREDRETKKPADIRQEIRRERERGRAEETQRQQKVSVVIESSGYHFAVRKLINLSR